MVELRVCIQAIDLSLYSAHRPSQSDFGILAVNLSKGLSGSSGWPVFVQAWLDVHDSNGHGLLLWAGGLGNFSDVCDLLANQEAVSFDGPLHLVIGRKVVHDCVALVSGHGHVELRFITAEVLKYWYSIWLEQQRHVASDQPLLFQGIGAVCMRRRQVAEAVLPMQSASSSHIRKFGLCLLHF